MGHIIRIRDIICRSASVKNINLSAETKKRISELLANGDDIADILESLSADMPDILNIIFGAAVDNLRDYTTRLRNALI